MLKIGSNYVLYADKYNFKLTYIVGKEDKQSERTVGYYSSYDGVVRGMVSDMQRRAVDNADITMDCIAVLREETEKIIEAVNLAVEAVREIKPTILYVPTKGRTSQKADTQN